MWGLGWFVSWLLQLVDCQLCVKSDFSVQVKGDIFIVHISDPIVLPTGGHGTGIAMYFPGHAGMVPRLTGDVTRGLAQLRYHQLSG